MNIKEMKSVYLIAALFTVLIFSGVGFSLISFVSSVYAQIDGASIVLDEPLLGPVIDDENALITPQGGLSSDQCTITDTSTTACLLVTKRVLDPENRLTEAEENALQFRIEVIVRGNVVTASDILRDGETLAVDINDGERYSVREVDNLGGAETRTDFDRDCLNILVEARQTYRCEVRNTVLSPDGNGALIIPQGGGTPLTNTQSQDESRRVITPQAGVTTQAGLTGGPINPPFETCNTRTERGTVTTPGGQNQQSAEVRVRSPNAATHTLSGSIDLDELRKGLERFGTQRISILVLNDLNNNDPLILRVSAPQFYGVILAADKQGVNHEIVKFNLDTIRTECKYVTISSTVGPAPNVNVGPIGVLGQPTSNDRKASQIDELLVADQNGITTQLTVTNPSTLNPVFSSCESSNAQSVSTDVQLDDVAIYGVRGYIPKAQFQHLTGDELNVEINVDLNPSARDLLKIMGENNPYVKVNLIADEDDNGHRIDFVLSDLWTDCKEVALNSEPIFKLIASEIPP